MYWTLFYSHTFNDSTVLLDKKKKKIQIKKEWVYSFCKTEIHNKLIAKVSVFSDNSIKLLFRFEKQTRNLFIYLCFAFYKMLISLLPITLAHTHRKNNILKWIFTVTLSYVHERSTFFFFRNHLHKTISTRLGFMCAKPVFLCCCSEFEYRSTTDYYHVHKCTTHKDCAVLPNSKTLSKLINLCAPPPGAYVGVAGGGQ